MRSNKIGGIGNENVGKSGKSGKSFGKTTIEKKH